jgi:hypothetical protein
VICAIKLGSCPTATRPPHKCAGVSRESQCGVARFLKPSPPHPSFAFTLSEEVAGRPESPKALQRQTCASTSDRPCALPVTELHELQSVIPNPPAWFAGRRIRLSASSGPTALRLSLRRNLHLVEHPDPLTRRRRVGAMGRQGRTRRGIRAPAGERMCSPPSALGSRARGGRRRTGACKRRA